MGKSCRLLLALVLLLLAAPALAAPCGGDFNIPGHYKAGMHGKIIVK